MIRLRPVSYTHLNYTREAGVRNLERRIGEICRKAAREFLERDKTSVRVTEANLEKYLGKENITFEDANQEDQVGIVLSLIHISTGSTWMWGPC